MAYYALDRERYLDILTGYVVVPRNVRLLWRYWDHLIMVANAGGCYGNPLEGYQGVTQGDLLSPMLFNVVIKALICHWITVVVEGEVGPGGFGRAVQSMVKFFYVDNSLLTSTHME